MKKLYLLVFFCISFSLCISQDNTHDIQPNIKISTISLSGSTYLFTVNNTVYFVSQSIGQASVIGTYSKNGYTIRQGYQQPQVSINKIPMKGLTLKTKVYPNPFKESITVAFNEAINSDVEVSLYDISGRRLYMEIFKPAQVLQIALYPDSNGIYFLNISANQKTFSTKLIKY